VRFSALLFAIVSLNGPAAAGESWTRARTPLVEVFTDASPAYARAAAEHVGAFDRVLRSAIPGPRAAAADLAAPVVFAFAGRGALAGVVPIQVAEPHRIDGVILGGVDRTYLAVDLDGRADDPFEPLSHEYAHFVLNAGLPAQPPWLAEGLATLLAGAVTDAGSVTLGAPVPAHLRRLTSLPSLPVADVLAVGYASPTYLGDGRRDDFYARSWLLAHWIVAGGHGGMAGLVAYAGAIADGVAPAAAFERSFGVSVAAAEEALDAYARAPLPVASVALAPAGGAAVEASAAAPADVARHRAELLLRGGRTAAARDVLRRAADQAPGSAAVQEGLAAVALKEERIADAERHLASALAASPGDPRALLRRAQLTLRAAAARGDVPTDAETGAAADLLARAVEADPDLADAADLLARLRPAPLAHRIALLRRAVARQPERAELAFTLAGLHMKLNEMAEASRVLRRAQSRTRDESHRFLAGHLLARVAAQGIREARGVLERVECLSGGGLAFTVRTASDTLRLAAASARDVLLLDANGETHERELTCGAADLPVVARYRATAGGDTAVSLSFEQGS
jgi:tetratricopeptide (TPR) repeat protein